MIQTETTLRILAPTFGDATSADAEQINALELSRRLDWRFLLPDPRLRNVVFVGAPDGHLARALRAFSGRLTIFDGTTPMSAPAEVDLVVAVGPGRETISLAAKLLRPGGLLYAEFSRPWAAHAVARAPAAMGVKGATEALQESGFAKPAVHWHLPDFENCAHIISANDGDALRWTLERSAGNTVHALRASFLRAALTIGVLSELIPCVSVVAERLPS